MKFSILIFLVSIFQPCLPQNQYDDDALLRELANMNKEMRNCQNYYRKMHNVPNLVINAELVMKAQDEAIRLSQIGRLEFGNVYLNGVKVGSVLWGKSSKSGNIAKEACDSWYSQNIKHNFDGDWNQQTGSFTQMVWKSTTEIGTGSAVAPNGWIYVVTLYNPSGNVLGQFRNNVFPKNSGGGSSYGVTQGYQNNYYMPTQNWITTASYQPYQPVSNYDSGNYGGNYQEYSSTQSYQNWNGYQSQDYGARPANQQNSNFNGVTPNSQKKAQLIELFKKLTSEYGLN